MADAVDTVVCPPDDGGWYHPKHVKQFPDKIFIMSVPRIFLDLRKGAFVRNNCGSVL
jgi:hypothetical protein